MALLFTIFDMATTFQGLLGSLLGSEDGMMKFVLHKGNVQDEDVILAMNTDKGKKEVNLCNFSQDPVTATFAKSDPTDGNLSIALSVAANTILDVTPEFETYQDASTLSLVSYNPSEKVKMVQDVPTVIKYHSKFFKVESLILLVPGLSIQPHFDRVSVTNDTDIDFELQFIFSEVPPKIGFLVGGVVNADSSQDFPYPGGNEIGQLVENISCDCSSASADKFSKYMKKVMGDRVKPIEVKKETKKLISTPTKMKINSPFAQKLEDLQEMGFPNREKNIVALVSTKGDVLQAVNVLVA